ncbi:MAG: hypothetical protein ABIK77_00705 [candidate division WOR-3 bacterium]|uniref:Uncharacterized protein n=1 Tax=candidate division WOR-3 bacterium TaxID=2052148 RepID=A0A7V4CH14_UNCW3
MLNKIFFFLFFFLSPILPERHFFTLHSFKLSFKAILFSQLVFLYNSSIFSWISLGILLGELCGFLVSSLRLSSPFSLYLFYPFS